MPGHKYIGPGNSLNRGAPVDRDDEIARKHDLAYRDATKYDHIRQADKKAILDFGEDALSNWNYHSALGAAGIGLKYGVESFAGVQYPKITGMEPALKKVKSFEISSSDGTNASNPQRVQQLQPASTSGGSQAPSATTATPPDGAVNDIEMAASGLTGTGKEQASGGASSDGKEVHVIERPLSIFENRVNTYRKSHKFMTFGLAPAIIANGAATTGENYLTSYLAEIPWHIPALYLNESEFYNSPQ